MGFFTDAYDLWIIGVALLFIEPQFHPSAEMIGLLASAALFGAFIGPLIFGYLSDRLGRKYVYGIEMGILAIGAFASALAPTFIFLIIARVVMGVGIGGDYPTSATIMSEYSNRLNRGRLVSMVFAMQGIGILTGIAVAFGLLGLHVNPGMIWRIMLGIGAIPAISVIYLRRTIPETPRYSLAAGNTSAAASAVQRVVGTSVHAGSTYSDRRSRRSMLRHYLPLLLGTSGSWLLFDMSYYGTGIFTPTLVQAFGFSGHLAAIQASAAIFALAAVPGYFVAVALIDREGRKTMQASGFILMGALFIAIYLLSGSFLALPSLFLLLYAMTFFFSNFGPNTTTFVYPTEIFPTRIRSTAHGISASAGKLGAAISTLVFPILLVTWGKYNLMAFLGVIAVVGAILTIALLPETKRRTLEETSNEDEISLIRWHMTEPFEQILTNMHSISSLLSDVVEGKVKASVAVSSAKGYEHDGDEAVRRVYDILNKERVSTSDKIDVTSLITRLDDVTDAIEATIYRLYLYDIRKSNTLMHNFAKGIGESTALICDGVRNLEELLDGNTSRFDASQARVRELENEGDLLLRRGLSEIMRGERPDPVQIIKYKDLYEHMEGITDKCEDVTDIFSDFAIKYAG